MSCKGRRSVTALGVGSLLALSAYRGLASLQGSINPSGLGTSSLAGTTAVFTGTLLLLAASRDAVDRILASGRVGYQYVASTCIAVCSWYVLAQTLSPSDPPPPGVGADVYVRAIVWTSGATGAAAALGVHCTWRYLAHLRRVHPQLKVTALWKVALLWEMAGVGGNLISSIVLSTLTTDATTNIRENITESCGINFWPGDKYLINNDIPNLNRPSNYVMNWICGIYFGFMTLSALIITLGVEDPVGDESKKADTRGVVQEWGDNCEKDADHEGCDIQQVLCTLLLAPMLLSLGIGRAFLEADFTSAYVTCSLGLTYVGWTMICHSLLDGLGLAIGYYLVVKENLSRPLRVAVTLAAVLCQLGFIYALHTPTLWVTGLFGAVGVFGLGSGVLLAKATLERTTSLATSMLFILMGLILGYSYSVHLSTEIKLYILTGSTLVGLLGFLAAEFRTLEPKDAALKARPVIT